MIVDELVSLLGLDIDPKAEGTARRFGQMLGGVIGLALKAGAALTTAATGLQAYAAIQAKAIDDSATFATRIGTSYERLQELEYAAEAAGGSVDALRSDLDKLSKSWIGGRNTDPADKLLRIAQRLQGMSGQRQRRWAEALGVSDETLLLIQKGREGIEQLTKRARELGLVMGETAVKRAREYRAAFLDMRRVVQSFGQEVSIGLLPNLTKIIKGFTEWVRVNREWLALKTQDFVKGVTGGFQLLGRVISWLWGLFEKLVGPVGEVVKQLDLSQPIMLAVASALGLLALASIAVAAPWLLWGAAIAALILLLDDLYAYLNGADSLIGRFIGSFQKAYPEISKAVTQILDFIVNAFETFGVKMSGGFTDRFKAMAITALTFVTNLLDGIEGLLAANDPWEYLWQSFKKACDKILALAGDVAAKIGEKMLEGLRKLDPTTWSWFGLNSSATPTPQQFGPSVPLVPPGPMTAPVAPGLLQQQGFNGGTTNNTFNINGAKDPRAVGQEVMNRGGLGASLQQIRPGMLGPTVG